MRLLIEYKAEVNAAEKVLSLSLVLQVQKRPCKRLTVLSAVTICNRMYSRL